MPPYVRIKGNISTLFERFNAKKLCGGVSSRECQFYMYNSELAFMSHPLKGLSGNICDSFLGYWKARSLLSIGFN